MTETAPNPWLQFEQSSWRYLRNIQIQLSVPGLFSILQEDRDNARKGQHKERTMRGKENARKGQCREWTMQGRVNSHYYCYYTLSLVRVNE